MHITVVCTGNICRSPMGEVILRAGLEEAGIATSHSAAADAAESSAAGSSASADAPVTLNSCGLGGWHIGDGADGRAVDELASMGYDGTAHRAAQLGPEHLGADLFLAMDDGHVRGLRNAGVAQERIRLFRSFDANSPAGAEVADPYYGHRSDFTEVGQQIEAAVPGIVEYVREQLGR
ncbi:low molecular weight protein-tyrosine-phosphatase [Corynebacterium jeikeium]|uniref:low molecular weight protein-tyrosine-phosphatase n=1 Tax=Corynebacterium jeikeium TaxID=38289 RepID=UPI0008921675|nr:low molecular weight protein-tyrosine-phosphatase [Corynebacterium jeikeium]SCX09025.1 putative low molecular weight protein-tyrosine-phosphatase [Corynebacterium jeikeium]